MVKAKKENGTGARGSSAEGQPVVSEPVTARRRGRPPRSTAAPESSREPSSSPGAAAPRVGRPATTPRLRSLDGDQLSAEIASLLNVHVEALPNLLATKIRPRELSALVTSALSWVREGQPAIGEANFIELARALFGRAVDSYETGLQWCARCKGSLVENQTPLGTFILAGEARHRLVSGRNVTAPQLAALANFDRTRIFQLIGDKDLEKPRSNEISAESALRLLVQAGVPGFDRASAKAST